MNTWTTDELAKITGSDELTVAGLKQDGTLWNPVTIWVVRVNSDLYVRSVKGNEGKWYQHAINLHQGHITAGGISKNVTFIQASEETSDEIDNAYLSKYSGYGEKIVASTLTPVAQAATLKISPR